MKILAPDILEEARTLSPILSGAGLLIGFLLWSLGGRTHRFWLAMIVTLAAGLLGLAHGKQFGMQPLVAGVLLAVSAGGLALSLGRILLFSGGGPGGGGALSLVPAGGGGAPTGVLSGGAVWGVPCVFWC